MRLYPFLISISLIPAAHVFLHAQQGALSPDVQKYVRVSAERACKMAFDANTVRRDYGDPELEAYACRTDCALFDYTFIGRARLNGPGALDAIGELTRRPLAGAPPGRIRYALREDSNGHVLSDLTVWRHGETSYEVMSGRSEDISDLVLTARPDCDVEDLSARTSIFALQGPGSLQALAGLADVGALSKLGYFTFVPIRICDVDCIM